MWNTANGGVRFGGRHARVGPLDDWSLRLVGLYVRNVDPAPDEPLCVSVGLDAAYAAHVVTARLNRAIADAGLSERAGVTGASIRLTSARRVLHDDGIVAAAKFLGSTSLDRTASALNYAWRAQDG